MDDAGRNGAGLIGAAAVSGADDAVGKIARRTARIHIHQLGSEIGIGSRGRGVQRKGYRPGNLDIGREGRRRVAEHIAATLQLLLVVCAAGNERRATAQRAASGWNRIAGIIQEHVGRFFTRGIGRQDAIAGRSIGPTAAVQVVVGEPGSSQRPFLFVAPTVVTHDEDANRRIGFGAVLLAL